MDLTFMHAPSLSDRNFAQRLAGHAVSVARRSTVPSARMRIIGMQRTSSVFRAVGNVRNMKHLQQERTFDLFHGAEAIKELDQISISQKVNWSCGEKPHARYAHLRARNAPKMPMRDNDIPSTEKDTVTGNYGAMFCAAAHKQRTRQDDCTTGIFPEITFVLQGACSDFFRYTARPCNFILN